MEEQLISFVIEAIVHYAPKIGGGALNGLAIVGLSSMIASKFVKPKTTVGKILHGLVNKLGFNVGEATNLKP